MRPDQIDWLKIAPLDEKVGGNSRVLKVEMGGKHFALKDYSSSRGASERIANEWLAAEFLAVECRGLAPDPVWIDEKSEFAVYRWIDGVTPGLTLETLGGMIQILGALQKASIRSLDSPILGAKGNILERGNLVRDVYTAIETLEQDSTEWKRMQANRLRRRAITLDWRESDERPLPSSPVLSPSDFGPHNMIYSHSSNWHIVDLEHFGWDDPHKLIVDTLLHPRLEWSGDLPNVFLAKGIELFELSERRIAQLVPLLALKWCTIALRAALDDDASTRLSKPSRVSALDFVDSMLDPDPFSQLTSPKTQFPNRLIDSATISQEAE